MINPWLSLPQKAPFVLPEDLPAVMAFNQKYQGETCELRTDLPPEPYSGRADAPVVLLTLNPGYNPLDADFMLKNSEFAACMEHTRKFEEQDYPLYHLDERFPDNPGWTYWNKMLKQPIADTNRKLCSQSFLLLQLFPYKSERFKKMGILPSFDFTRDLLLKAMERQALVIQMRSKTLWERYVPQLKEYPHRFVCHSCLCPVISSNNLGNEEYRQVIKSIDTYNKNI